MSSPELHKSRDTILSGFLRSTKLAQSSDSVSDFELALKLTGDFICIVWCSLLWYSACKINYYEISIGGAFSPARSYTNIVIQDIAFYLLKIVRVEVSESKNKMMIATAETATAIAIIYTILFISYLRLYFNKSVRTRHGKMHLLNFKLYCRVIRC